MNYVKITAAPHGPRRGRPRLRAPGRARQQGVPYRKVAINQ